MITKRNGNGQTECVGCKEKGKFASIWDSWLYNFNGKPYCQECLFEMLEEYQQRIDKAIEYIENDLKSFIYSIEYKTLLSILKDIERRW